MSSDPPSARSSPSIDSQAPEIHGEAHSAANVLPMHPVWASASRRGAPVHALPVPTRPDRPRGKQPANPPPASDADGLGGLDRPRYEKISLAALEAEHFDADADSKLDSEDEAAATPKRRKRAHVEQDGHERKERGERGEYDERDDPDERDERERSKIEQLMGAAAFGGGAHQTPPEDSLCSETESKQQRDAFKDAFPVHGISCVGCALSNRITPVDRFIKDNIAKMSETALWYVRFARTRQNCTFHNISDSNTTCKLGTVHFWHSKTANKTTRYRTRVLRSSI